MTSETESEKTAEDWYKQGLALGRAGANEESINAYKKAVEQDPGHFKSWFNLGIRYGKILQNIASRDSFKKALEIKPDDTMCYYSLAVVSNLIGEMEEAFGYYKEAIRVNPEFARAHSNLAMLYYSLKKGKDTVRHLRIAEKLFKEQGDTMMQANARDLLGECKREFGIGPDDEV